MVDSKELESGGYGVEGDTGRGRGERRVIECDVLRATTKRQSEHFNFMKKATKQDMAGDEAPKFNTKNRDYVYCPSPTQEMRPRPHTRRCEKSRIRRKAASTALSSAASRGRCVASAA
jgi:hypothetical protein